MKQVFLFKHDGEVNADKLEEIRAEIKKQIAEGVVVTDGKTDFIGVFTEPQEPRPLLPMIARTFSPPRRRPTPGSSSLSRDTSPSG